MKRMISDAGKLEQLAKKTTINKDGSVSIEGVGGNKLYQHNITILSGNSPYKIRVAFTIINNSNEGFTTVKSIKDWLDENGFISTTKTLLCNGYIITSSTSTTGQVFSMYRENTNNNNLAFNLVGTDRNQYVTAVPGTEISTINDVTIEL